MTVELVSGRASGIRDGPTSTHHSQEGLHAQQIGVAHRELRQDAHRVLQIAPALLVLLLRDDVAHDAEAVRDCQRDVQAGPPAGAVVRPTRVLQIDETHEGRLMEQGQHAVEVREVVLQQRNGLFLAR